MIGNQLVTFLTEKNGDSIDDSEEGVQIEGNEDIEEEMKRADYWATFGFGVTGYYEESDQEELWMSIKSWIKKVENSYVINQANNAKLPQFAPDDMVRRHYIFKGRVQKVGFRIELAELSKRLGLTGWVNNLPNGDVEAEIQGPKNKIDFLVLFMESLKRIKITFKEVNEIPLMEEEGKFESDKEY